MHSHFSPTIINRMDVIFAKAAPAPSHHYSRLLKRNKASEQPSTEEFFAVKPPSSPHLYTPRGIIKGHRRTNSEVPPESPNGGKLRNSVLSKTTEKSHFELSAELTTSLHQRLEDIVQHLDSTQRQDLTILIEKLKSETQAAKAEANLLKQETEQMKSALKDSEIRLEEAEVKCARLQTQVAMLTQENQELEVRASEDFRIERDLRDSISLSFDKDFPGDSVSSLQRELREKALENEKLQKMLNEALRELKSAKGRLKTVGDRGSLQ